MRLSSPSQRARAAFPFAQSQALDAVPQPWGSACSSHAAVQAPALLQCSRKGTDVSGSTALHSPFPTHNPEYFGIGFPFHCSDCRLGWEDLLLPFSGQDSLLEGWDSMCVSALWGFFLDLPA